MFSLRKRGGLSISQIPTSIGDLSRLPRSPHWDMITVHPNSSEMEMAEQLEPMDSSMSSCFLLDFFNVYYIPLIILLGLVGNLLSCVVFLKTQLRTRSSSYYLAALSIADSGFLVTLFLVWLNNTVDWQVYNKEGWCETLVYVSAVCSSLSIWLIVAFTVERYIAFRYPLHRPYICTVERAKSITLVLVLVAMLLHMYAFFFAGVVKNADGEEFCELKIEHLEAMRIISIVDSIISLIAPIVGIIVMNTMIVKNLLLFRRLLARNRAARPANTESEQNDVNDHIYVNDIPTVHASINRRRDINPVSFTDEDRNDRVFKPIEIERPPKYVSTPIRPIRLSLPQSIPSSTRRYGCVWPGPEYLVEEKEDENVFESIEIGSPLRTPISSSLPIRSSLPSSIPPSTKRYDCVWLGSWCTLQEENERYFESIEIGSTRYVSAPTPPPSQPPSPKINHIYANQWDKVWIGSARTVEKEEDENVFEFIEFPSMPERQSEGQPERQHPIRELPPSLPQRANHHRTSNITESHHFTSHQNTTKVLLLISTVFIVLNLPSYIIRLCVFFLTLVEKEAPDLLWCLQQLFMLPYYTNFSINFLLYAMYGVAFRSCLRTILRKATKCMRKHHKDRNRFS
ncbi:PREDICTED: uncharacterized protein LOC106745398 [Dinoponera quadriceps]|uniref:Uncharacterized protein LOC106745398 n=1 Tax=Dinoponera quadriceps TaxID=609295 RepID=A0A6P3XE24_DINQU|nr:PREDICTED: uncharacterized protein LOC106745398 [Dinoponera quadriceps]